MAITLVSRPPQFSRVYDTNRCSYTFSSDQYTQLNYNFLIELYMFEPAETGSTGTLIGTFKFYPLDNGTCVFNPTTVYKNYITSDLNLSTSSLDSCDNSAKEFRVLCYDYYSSDVDTPPAKQGSAYEDSGRGLVFYNGCQQEVPYDYTALNVLQGDNLQWVMSGTSIGKFLTDASEYRLDNDDVAFLYFLGKASELPWKIRYTVYYYSTTGSVQAIPETWPTDAPELLTGLATSFYHEISESQSMPQTKTSTSSYSETETSVPVL